MNADLQLKTITKGTLRGWKQICPFVGYSSYRPARKHLKKLGLLFYENRRPVLSVDAYRLEMIRRQMPQNVECITEPDVEQVSDSACKA